MAFQAPKKTGPSPRSFQAGDTLGVIAGQGTLPIQLGKAVTALGGTPFFLVVDEAYDLDALKPHSFEVLSLGAIGQAIKLLRRQDIRHICFAGRIQRPNLKTFKTDRLGLKWLMKLMPKMGRDDALLRTVIQLFEGEGFEVLSLKDLLPATSPASSAPLSSDAPQSFLSKGYHMGPPLSAEDDQDIARGVHILKILGGEDVGQAVVVHQDQIIGIEATEGTDQLLIRCGTYLTQEKNVVTEYRPENAEEEKASRKKGILVKFKKAHQDDRADLPVVGPRTIERMVEAGLKGLAIQADNVIVVDKSKVETMIQENGLFLRAL